MSLGRIFTVRRLVIVQVTLAVLSLLLGVTVGGLTWWALSLDAFALVTAPLTWWEFWPWLR